MKMYSWQLFAFCSDNIHVVLVFFLSLLGGFCKESKELKSVFHSAVWTQFWGDTSFGMGRQCFTNASVLEHEHVPYFA